MTIIIKLQGLPLEASSIDVRRYFLGLTIPDGGVHIVGGDDGTVFIEFANDEDARQAMAKGDGNIRNSNIKLLLSSRTEMQTIIEAARIKKQQYLHQQQQQQQHNHQHQLPHQNILQQHNNNSNATTNANINQVNQQHIQSQNLIQAQSPLSYPNTQPVSVATSTATSPNTTSNTTITTNTTQPSSFVDPRLLSQNYQDMMSASAAINQAALAAAAANQQNQQHQHHQQQQTLLPQNNQIFTHPFNPAPFPTTTSNVLGLNLLGNVGLVGANVASSVAGIDPSILIGTGGMVGAGGVGGMVTGANLLASNLLGSNSNQIPNSNNNNNSPNNNNFNGSKMIQTSDNNNGLGINNSINQNQSADNRARMSGMRGGDDKLFANKRCVLAASNIPYRATSKDIIEFLSEFSITEDCIRRRYNQKGQPTADAKIAFPTPDAAMKALKSMNKKTLCGRPVFLKPV